MIGVNCKLGWYFHPVLLSCFTLKETKISSNLVGNLGLRKDSNYIHAICSKCRFFHIGSCPSVSRASKKKKNKQNWEGKWGIHLLIFIYMTNYRGTACGLNLFFFSVTLPNNYYCIFLINNIIIRKCHQFSDNNISLIEQCSEGKRQESCWPHSLIFLQCHLVTELYLE